MEKIIQQLDIAKMLEESFSYAFSSGSSYENLEKLVSYYGNLVQADRFYIFKNTNRGVFHVDIEWCKEGVSSESDVLPTLPVELIEGIVENYEELEGALFVEDIEVLRDVNPFLYGTLKGRGVRSFLAERILHNDSLIGFYGIENLDIHKAREISEIFTVLSFIFAGLISRRSLEKRMERIGFRDRLTGVGNRQYLYESCNRYQYGETIGVLYIDILNLRDVNRSMGEGAGDTILIRSASIFSKYFGTHNVFRVGGDEFVVVMFGLEEENFLAKIEKIKKDMSKENIECSTGFIYEKQWNSSIDTLMRKADLKVFDEKRALYRQTDLEKLDMENERENDPVHAIESLTELNFSLNSFKVLYSHGNRFQYLGKQGPLREVYEVVKRKYVHPSDQEYYNKFWDIDIESHLKKQENGELSIEYRLPGQDGGWDWMRETLYLVDSHEDNFTAISSVRNLSDAHQILSLRDREGVKEFSDAVHVDMYQGEDAFNRANIWLSRTSAHNIAMVAIDLNNFKLYNSIFGRSAGDRLLELTSELLKEAVQKNGGLTGYIGGDNFMLIMPADGRNQDDLKAWAESQIQSLDLPNGFVPAFGFCITSDRKISANLLYERALMIIGNVKNNYTNHVAFFDESLYIRSQQDQLLLMDIEKGLREKEFTFYLQPKVKMQTGKIVSFEALVRWLRNGKVVSPAVFVDLMEATGYIHALDEFIWEEVCKLQRKLLDEGKDPLPISFNVSRVDFHFGAVGKTIIGLANQYQLDHSLIQIEVTESAYARDPEIIRSNVSQLHDEGFTILMDDFGKGYSSLNSLRGMHVDVLKLDKKFIDAMDSNETDRNIVETVIRMAHLIGMNVVVEGVETKRQVEELMRIHCMYAQGYYYYRPLPIKDALALVNEDSIERGEPEEETRRIEAIHLDELMDAKMIDVLQLNRMIGGLAIVRFADGKADIMQFNHECVELFGVPTHDRELYDKAMTILEGRLMSRPDVFEAARANPKEGFTHVGVYAKPGEEVKDIVGTIFPLKSLDQSREMYLLWLRRP
ncbi:MAG: EAL domain-containing protein [Solobacterium sp.]|nr:EAL domain-containing protein [Solobacterium sp.]